MIQPLTGCYRKIPQKTGSRHDRRKSGPEVEFRMAAISIAESVSAARPAVPSSERPVDLVHLARQTLGDRSLEREVLQLFVRQSEICLARLRGAADQAAWTAAAHSIKGSARAIGAWRVARAAESAEALGRPARDPAETELLAALEAEIAAAKAFIGDLLSIH